MEQQQNQGSSAVEPQVILLAITRGSKGESPQEVIELAARNCYQSLPSMKPEDTPRFLRSLLVRGHESVIEHASATFIVAGGSRAYTHEQVRHRLASYSQQSQRFVAEENFRYIIPPEIAKDAEALRQFEAHIESSRRFYGALQEMGFKNEDARFVLPNAVESRLVSTFNFRELRHIFDLRLAPNAQWEIRRIVLKMLQKEAPVIFEEFVLDEEKFTAIRCGKLVPCEEAQQRVRDLSQKYPRILHSLSEKENFAPLSHIAKCYNPVCQKMRAELGF
jgi:thymidylate synthase (FAD)